MGRACCCCRCQYPDLRMGDDDVTEYEWLSGTVTVVSSVSEQVNDTGTNITCQGQRSTTEKPPCRHIVGETSGDGTPHRYDWARIYENISFTPDGINDCVMDWRLDFGNGTIDAMPAIRHGSTVASLLFTTGDPRYEDLSDPDEYWVRRTISGLSVSSPSIIVSGQPSGSWRVIPTYPTTTVFTPDFTVGAPPIYFGFAKTFGSLGTTIWEQWYDSLCIDFVTQPL